MTYAITSNEALRELCIKNDWFSCGTNSQYEKLFYANDQGFSIEEIATIIWLCSDNRDKSDILEELIKARLDFWSKYFMLDPEQNYQMWCTYGCILESSFSGLIDTLLDPDDEDYTFDTLTKFTDLTGKTVWEADGGEE